jgi:flagellar biosynthesis chaperone FliJ
MSETTSDTKPEIYTLEKVTELTNNVLKLLQEDEKKEYVFIGQLLEAIEVSRSRWHEWKKKFNDNEQILCTMERVESILESRAFVGAMKNEYNSTMTKLHLMSNYGWKERQELDHGGKVDTGNDQLKIIANSIRKLTDGPTDTTGSEGSSQENS